MSTYTFDHPSLGKLIGVQRGDDVVQFRTIPYARLPARFQQSRAITELEAHERDCTEFGPACPAQPQSQDAFGGSLPGEKDVWYDEMRCLNATVTVPRSSLDGNGSSKVPVMVHVHGGGFTEGSHTSGVRDTARMVQLSVKEKMPVIIISISYRLNWLGFLACQDLVDEAAKSGEPVSNFGFHDQRAGFKWVHKHVSGFGGNSGNVTAFGESAGSVSLALHMCSDEPLFDRAILQSGTAATGTPIDLASKEEQYRRLLRFCGIDENATDRLDQLRRIPVQTLIDGIRPCGVLAFAPLDHDSFFHVIPTRMNEAEIIANCGWVKELMIGDCRYEGFLFAGALQNVTPASLVSHLQINLEADFAQKLLSAYSITPDMDQNLFWTRINELVGDITFSEGTHNLIVNLAAFPGSKKKLYRYNATLRNPFPGSIFHAVSGHHFIELAFQFMTLLDRYPEQKLRDISTDFARKLMLFANGRAPWTEFDSSRQTLAIVSSRDGWQTFTRAEDEAMGDMAEEGGRRYRAWEVLDAGFKSCGAQALAARQRILAEALIALGGR